MSFNNDIVVDDDSGVNDIRDKAEKQNTADKRWRRSGQPTLCIKSIQNMHSVLKPVPLRPAFVSSEKAQHLFSLLVENNGGESDPVSVVVAPPHGHGFIDRIFAVFSSQKPPNDPSTYMVGAVLF